MKKIAISLLIVLFAIFAFFYVQLQQAKSLLTEQLTKRDIAPFYIVILTSIIFYVNSII